jgi:glyoxylase-like metal-dependent hydrolase (beta-lactamase superfamily II)
MTLELPRVRISLLRVGHCTFPEAAVLRGGGFHRCSGPNLSVLIEHPERGIFLFDTGYSEHFFRATRPFPERFYRWATPVHLAPGESLVAQLARLKIAPEDVRGIIVSHFHADHVAGLLDFPRPMVMTTRAGYETALELNGLRGLFKAHLPALLPADLGARTTFAEGCSSVPLPEWMQPFESGFDLLGDGSLIGIPLPGHAQAQLGLLLRGQDDQLRFFVADACWSARAYRENRMPSRAASLIFHDVATYRTTLAALSDLHRRAPELRIVPSHCEASYTADPLRCAPPT